MELKTERLELVLIDYLDLEEKKKLARSIVEEVDDDIIQNTTIVELLDKKGLDSYTYDFALEFVTDKESDSKQIFSINCKGAFIGFIGVHNIDKFNKSAEFGYWIGKNHRKNGFMSEALERLKKYCFEDLNLHKINVDAYAFNEGSNKVIVNSGFKKVGFHRDSIFRFGKYHDINHYDMLRSEWKVN